MEIITNQSPYYDQLQYLHEIHKKIWWISWQILEAFMEEQVKNNNLSEMIWVKKEQLIVDDKGALISIMNKKFDTWPGGLYNENQTIKRQVDWNGNLPNSLYMTSYKTLSDTVLNNHSLLFQWAFCDANNMVINSRKNDAKLQELRLNDEHKYNLALNKIHRLQTKRSIVAPSLLPIKLLHDLWLLKEDYQTTNERLDNSNFENPTDIRNIVIEIKNDLSNVKYDYSSWKKNPSRIQWFNWKRYTYTNKNKYFNPTNRDYTLLLEE